MAARSPDAEAVVVMRLDRLGRDAAETLTLLKVFARGRVGLISIDDRLDLGSPQGRAMAAMVCVFAELERGLIGQRVSDALQEKKRQHRVYGNTPFGWDRDGDFLVKNREEQATLRIARRLHNEGLSFHRIATYLNHKRRRTKHGGVWDFCNVRSVMRTSASLEGWPSPASHGGRPSPPVNVRAIRAAKRRKAPFGWMDTEHGRLANWPQQAALSRMLEMRAAKVGARKIAATLQAEGHPTVRGGKWDHSTVLEILANHERFLAASTVDGTAAEAAQAP
jgi:hypothetical protein